MEDRYFMELKGLVPDTAIAQDRAKEMRAAAAPWVSASSVSACLCPSLIEGDLFDYILINEDYIYFFRMKRDNYTPVSIKGFKASDMVAHAFLLPSAPQGAQIRLMLSDGKRIKLILHGEGASHDNEQLMKNLAKSAFFTAK